MIVIVYSFVGLNINSTGSHNFVGLLGTPSKKVEVS